MNESAYIKFGLKVLAIMMACWLAMIAAFNNVVPIKEAGMCILLYSAIFVIIVTYRRQDKPAVARKKKPDEPESEDEAEPYQPKVRVVE